MKNHLTEYQVEKLTKRAHELRSFDRIDDNPTWLEDGGECGRGVYACGPTTGEWLSLYNLEVVGQVTIEGVTFTLAI